VERRIFEPFYTTREKGIGLGLPLAKRIIEAHGGEIHLSENTDSQITFAVKLPGTKRENATW
jgi:signal transduction histidine kinase